MPINYVRKSYDDAVTAAADRLVSRVRTAFLDAVVVASSRVPLKALADALQRGDTAGIMAIIGDALADALKGSGLDVGQPSVRDALQATFAAGANAAVGELPAGVGMKLSFNLLNPKAVEWLQTYEMTLIRQITSDTREAIQAIVLRGYREGITVASQAREIRSIIGLTARQETAIATYRSALESGPAANLRDALARSLRDGRYDRTLLRSLETGQGLTQAQIDALVQRYRERYLKYRADMIARTETIRAANQGRRESWRQAREQGLIPDGAMRRWITSGDDRTCDECDGLDGELVGMDEDFPGGVDGPPAHPNCLTPGTLVLAESVTGAVRRRYEGPVCSIRFLGAPDLSVTPNHPVLTDKGWTRAGCLQRGDNVIQCLPPSEADPLLGRRNPNNDYVYAPVEEIFQSLIETVHMSRRLMPVTAKAFHGDVGLNEEVEVVGTASLLEEYVIADDPQFLEYLLFCVRHGGRIAFDTHSLTTEMLNRAFFAADGFVGRSGAGLAGFGRSVAGLNQVRVSAVALLESENIPVPTNGDPGYSRTFGNAENALALSVALVKVDEVNVTQFRGHVYNLETKSGSYLSNSIVTHNCRCSVALKFPAREARAA